MVVVSIRDQLLDEFDRLSSEQQEQVLEFARSLKRKSIWPPGTPGKVLLATEF